MLQRNAFFRRITRQPAPWVCLAALLALTVRLVLLAEPALRWDEGWSLAQASLPWDELWRVASLEWHPPLYAITLKLWLVLGKSAWTLRLLSVVAGVLTVPLTYRVARAWSGRGRVAVVAAILAAVWPMLVYYGQVTRPYAMMALPVLGTAWFAVRPDGRRMNSSLRGVEQPGEERMNSLLRMPEVGLVICSALALYLHYYTIWALAGIWIYAAILRPRRISRLLLAGLVTGLVYVPWLLTAATTIQQRLSTGALAGGDPLRETIKLLSPTLQGLAFIYESGWRAAWGLGIITLAGAAVGSFARSEWRAIVLPLLVVSLSVVGIAYGAQASHWFAIRYLVPASVFLCLGLAWALDRLATRFWPLMPTALLILAILYWPTSTRFVYAKMLEVVDPFDPTEDYRYLAAHAGAQDLVYFNVLARAGWYEAWRQPQNPTWSYAMRWDPIIEPMDMIAARIMRDAQGSPGRPAHHRLWFALYKGDYGSNAPLKAWLDEHLYPAGGEWQNDMLYQAYVVPPEAWASASHEELFEQGIRLVNARWAASAPTGDTCAIELTWQADRPVATGYKVFIHALDDAGNLVAQHDAIPGTGSRPSNSWSAGEAITDRHGLLLPIPGSPGTLHLVLGLYDPQTGQRLHLADGREAVELGTVHIK